MLRPLNGCGVMWRFDKDAGEKMVQQWAGMRNRAGNSALWSKRATYRARLVASKKYAGRPQIGVSPLT